MKYKFKLSEIILEYIIKYRKNREEDIVEIVRNDEEMDFFYTNIRTIRGEPICKQFYIPKNSFTLSELNWIYKEVFYPSKMNPHAYVQPNFMITPKDIVIDAGACEGFFVEYALRLKADKVIAFEPINKIKKALCVTYEEELKVGKVIVEALGLSNVVQESFLTYQDGAISSASIESNNDIREIIKTITLDIYCASNNISKVDFIKMDIEGEEIKAIEGAKEIICANKPKLSIAVYHSYENAMLISNMVKSYRNDYKIEFRGYYAWELPARPYMLIAY